MSVREVTVEEKEEEKKLRLTNSHPTFSNPITSSPTAFTAVCNAAGLEARLVLDFSDHVW